MGWLKGIGGGGGVVTKKAEGRLEEDEGVQRTDWVKERVKDRGGEMCSSSIQDDRAKKKCNYIKQSLNKTKNNLQYQAFSLDGVTDANLPRREQIKRYSSKEEKRRPFHF